MRTEICPADDLAEFDQLFPDINSCKRYLMERPWPNVPRCREREGLLGRRRLGSAISAARIPIASRSTSGPYLGTQTIHFARGPRFGTLSRSSKKGISALQNRLGGYCARRRVRLLPFSANISLDLLGLFAPSATGVPTFAPQVFTHCGPGRG